MAKLSYGIPLAVAAAGTIAALFFPSKRAHVFCGIAWTGLSLLHAWQYRQKLKRDLGKGEHCLASAILPRAPKAQAKACAQPRRLAKRGNR